MPSRDAIPVHLLTAEPLHVRARDQAGCVIAFHLSNRYLNLPPVVSRSPGLKVFMAVLVADSAEDYDRLQVGLVARHPAMQLSARPEFGSYHGNYAPYQGLPGDRPINNLLQVLK